MTMVNNKTALSFRTRKHIKFLKSKAEINLKIDYNKIDRRDVYGFYLTNNTTKNNVKQLPDIGSFVDEYPDFMALESEPGLFHKTNDTCVCWFKDDSIFDTIDGIYNAIIYKDVELLKYYKERYYGVNYFVSPDYSLYGDFDYETLIHNIKKSIVVYMWLTIECEAIVFPLMTYGDEESLEWCFEHILIGSNVAVSLKGVMSGENKRIFQIALRKLVDSRKPKTLIVYTVASEESTKEILEYAIKNDVKIVVVPNTLMKRNRGDK